MARQALTGSRVRDRRLMLGLRQADLARAVEISPAYLNLIEHNRRRVGPELLAKLAVELKVEASVLAEGAEGALFDALREAAASPDPGLPPETDRLEEFGGRFPGWAALLAARQGQVMRLSHVVESLSERMAQDPFLAASLHEVLSAITAIRSTSAILAETEDLEPEWRARFHKNIHEDSLRLSNVSAALVAWLDQARAPESGLSSPMEEMEDWLQARDWHVGELEGSVEHVPESLIVGASQLASVAGRALTLAYLHTYRADAVALPLDWLLRALEQVGPDPLLLAQRLGLPVPLLLRRLACLPQGVIAGVGFAACDGSGGLLFRRPAPGFPMPRSGAACGLLPMFEALAQPATPLRRLVQVAGRGAGAKFWAYSWCDRSWPEGFDGPMVARALMLLIPAGAADGPVRRVGSSCRVCAEQHCAGRREPSFIV